MRRFEARSIAEIDTDNLEYFKTVLRFIRDVPETKTLSFRQEIDALLFKFSPSCQINQASMQQINTFQPRTLKRQKPDTSDDEIAVIDVQLGKPQLGLKVKEEVPPQVKYETDDRYHRISDQYQNYPRQQNRDPREKNQARNDQAGPSGTHSRSRQNTQPKPHRQASSSRYPPEKAYNERSSNQQKKRPKLKKSRNLVDQAERQSVHHNDQERRRKDHPMMQERNRRIENRQERSRSVSPSYLEGQADMHQNNYDDDRELQEDEHVSDHERNSPLIPGSSKQHPAAQVKNENDERRLLNRSPIRISEDDNSTSDSNETCMESP